MSILLTQPPKAIGISKSNLSLWLEGKDFSNSPPSTSWKDRSNGVLYSYNNVLLNADFTSQQNYWLGYGTGITNVALSGSYLVASCTQPSDGLQQAYTSMAGHKYYFRFTVKATSACTGGYGFATSGVASQVNTASVGTTDTQISGIITPTTSYASLVFGRPSNAVNNVYLKGGVLVVDLTAIFGSGNEPSQAWCDANLAFTYNGVYSSVIKTNDATPTNMGFSSISGSDGNGRVVLDGVDDYLTLQPIYFGSSDFTVYMDFVFKSYPSISGLLCLRTTVSSNCSYYLYYRNDTNLLQFCYSPDGISVAGLNYNVQMILGTRYKLVVKRQGSMMYMYLNGVCVATLNCGSASFYTSTDVLQIGALKSTTAGYFSNMYLYRAIIYKRCLPDSELAKIYNTK